MIYDQMMRVLSYPQQEEGELAAVILVATPLKAINNLLYDLLGMIIFSSPLAVLAMLWGGWFLSGRALEPINRMGNAMEEIDAGNLNQRVAALADRVELCVCGLPVTIKNTPNAI